VARALLDAITPIIDPLLSPAAYGFRPGLGVADAVQAVAGFRERGLRWTGTSKSSERRAVVAPNDRTFRRIAVTIRLSSFGQFCNSPPGRGQELQVLQHARQGTNGSTRQALSLLTSNPKGVIEMMIDAEHETDMRARAVKRLKKQRDFRTHLLVYLLVNLFLVAVWALTDGHGFFWPIFPMVGWGIGVILNAWDAYGAEEPSEQSIRREIERLEHRR
jgi:hypothetical protein